MPVIGNTQLRVVDTSAVIAFFRFDAETITRFEAVHLLLPTIVLGELYIGAYGAGPKYQQSQMTKIRDFVALSTVINLTDETTRHYARTKLYLRSRALMIPENDIWIAAFALEHTLPLATRDGHFDRVPGLVVDHW